MRTQPFCRIPAAVMAALVVSACTQSGNNPPQGAGATSGQGIVTEEDSLDPGSRGGDAQVILRAGMPAVRDPAGKLPHPLDYYKTHEAEFFDFVRQRNWYGTKRWRKCKHNVLCKHGARTRMSAEAIEGSDNLSFLGIAKDEHVIVGRLKNIGFYDDTVYDMVPPNPGGWTTEAYVVLEGTGTEVLPHLAILSFTGFPNPTPHLKVEDYVTPVTQCDNYHVSGYVGDFKACSRDRDPKLKWDDPVSVRDASEAFAWFSCAEGCCGSSFPPLLQKTSTSAASKPRS